MPTSSSIEQILHTMYSVHACMRIDIACGLQQQRNKSNLHTKTSHADCNNSATSRMAFHSSSTTIGGMYTSSCCLSSLLSESSHIHNKGRQTAWRPYCSQTAMQQWTANTSARCLWSHTTEYKFTSMHKSCQHIMPTHHANTSCIHADCGGRATQWMKAWLRTRE